MSKNILSIVADLENEILIKNKDSYDDKTKKVLQNFIAFLQDGSFTNSKSYKFYLKNFRLKNKDLQKRWNADPRRKPKNISTLTSQKSALNGIIEKMFFKSSEISEIFMSQDMDKMNRIQDNIIVLSDSYNQMDLENIIKPDILDDIKEQSESIFDEMYQLTFEDCKKAVYILLMYYSDIGISNNIKKIDSSIWRFLIKQLSLPCMNRETGELNEIKLNFLKAYDNLKHSSVTEGDKDT